MFSEKKAPSTKCQQLPRRLDEWVEEAQAHSYSGMKNHLQRQKDLRRGQQHSIWKHEDPPHRDLPNCLEQILY